MNQPVVTLGALAPDLSRRIGRSIDAVLASVRRHLDMDVGFVTEFAGDHRFFRHVDNKGDKQPVAKGASMPLSEGYCLRVVDGRLPELIADTANVPAALELADTYAIPIGAHLSVPIRLRSGHVYGTFCCFSFAPDPSLNPRDLTVMRTFADIIAQEIDEGLEADATRQEKVARIRHALQIGQPDIAFQPIHRLADGAITGVECLARFNIEPARGPDAWFAEAAEIGLLVELELQSVHRAIAEARALPDGIVLNLNVSPRAVIEGDIAAMLTGIAPERVVVELTEHHAVADYPQLLKSLDPLREKGVRVAIDDAGAGYASMRHVLMMGPDIIKLDISLTRDLDSDPMRHALAAALAEFARHTGSQIIAEGIETEEELMALKHLGIESGQGYYLSRPMALDKLLPLLGRHAA